MPSSTHDNSLGGYDESLFAELARVEDRHFWFRARNLLIYEVVNRLSAHLESGYRVLEVGCGTGYVLGVLRKACANGVVVGMERHFEGLPHAQRRSAGPLVQADARQLPFGKPFDLVGMFDVLEHIPEERETLLSLHSILAPGGKLILTVPAHQFLWSHFDEAAHHCRRYSSAQLHSTLTETGFAIDFMSQFGASIFPLVWGFRKVGGLRRSSSAKKARELAMQELQLIPVVNGALASLMSLEAKWLGRDHKLPFGTSLVCLARKI